MIGHISSAHLISSIFNDLSLNLKRFISIAINFGSDVCTETALIMNSNLQNLSTFSGSNWLWELAPGSVWCVLKAPYFVPVLWLFLTWNLVSLFHTHPSLVAFLQCFLSRFDNKENWEVFSLNQCGLKVRFAASFNLRFDVDLGILPFYESCFSGFFDFAPGFLIFPPVFRFPHGSTGFLFPKRNHRTLVYSVPNLYSIWRQWTIRAALWISTVKNRFWFSDVRKC